MENKKIETLILRYIIPFNINDDACFDDAVKSIKSFNTIRNGKPTGTNINPRLLNIKDSNNEKINFYWENEEKTNMHKDVYKYISEQFIFDATNKNENEKKIGVSLKLVNTKDKNRNYFPNFIWLLQDRDKKIIRHEFLISDIGMYLFRNNLGFLWYEINLEPSKKPNKAKYTYGPDMEMDSDDLIKFQNDIKELNSHNGTTFVKINDETVSRLNKNALYFKVKKGKNTMNLVPFSMGDWFNLIIQKTFKDVKFEYSVPRENSFNGKYINGTIKKLTRWGYNVELLNGTGKEAIKTNKDNINEEFNKYLKEEVDTLNVPDKGVIFTYASYKATNKMDACSINEEKKNYAFLLTNGYKKSYFYSEEEGHKMLIPFRNVLIYATNEGCTYTAWPYESDVINNKAYNNREFFKKNTSIEINDYFTLYIKVLYQSYSLLIFSNQTYTNISVIKEDYTHIYDNKERKKSIEKNRKSIESLIFNINLFLTKNITATVSHINHHNDYYNYLTQQLRIDEEVKSVMAGLDALNKIVSKQNDEELKRAQEQDRQNREEEKEKEEKQNERIQAVIGSLVIFEALDMFSTWGELCKNNNLHEVFLYVGWFIILMAFSLSVYVLGKAIIQMIKNLISIEKDKIKMIPAIKKKGNDKLETFISVLIIIIVIVIIMLVMSHFAIKFVNQ